MSQDKKEHVLVTGGAGYVGSTVIHHLLNRGYRVTAIDRLMFGGEALLAFWHHPQFEFCYVDLRDHDAVSRLLRNGRYNAVIHLAAIVGDPACSCEPELARETNWTASKNLADVCAEIGVGRFIFASTCSNYGKMENAGEYVDENSPLSPVSLYAELKVEFERYILGATFDNLNFCPTVLRFATVYGVAPRMRFDLTVNEFVKDVVLGRSLEIFGEQFWRPYCHVFDFANAFEKVLESPADLVLREVFNVGDTAENYTKAMLWNMIQEAIPHAKAHFVKKDEDPRDYRVNCDKIRNNLGFSVSRTVSEGILEVRDVVRSGVIRNPNSQKYYNIPYKLHHA